MKKEMPFWEKYTLTIEEAASYFRISDGKLRAFVAQHPNHPCIMWNGNRAQIKRKKFESYVDGINTFDF